MNVLVRLGILLVGAIVSLAVMAHAVLDRSIPLVGSSVKVAPGRVELWFTEPLEPAFSTVKVVDKGGRQVDARDAAVDKADRKHLFVSIGSLAAGRYRVVWRVVSVDSHATAGDFTFDVAP